MDYAFEIRPWRLALYILWVLFALSILIAMDCIFVRLVNQMTEPSYVDGDTSITETAYMDGAEEQEPVVALRACGFASLWLWRVDQLLWHTFCAVLQRYP